jgi:hypothetical protein
MLSYCYAWTPLVIIGSFALLALPWLGLIALFVLLAGALALLVGVVAAVVWLPLRVGRAIVARLHARIEQRTLSRGTRPRTVPGRQPTMPAGATAFISDPRSRRDR